MDELSGKIHVFGSEEEMQKQAPNLVPLGRLPQTDCNICRGTGAILDIPTAKYRPCTCTVATMKDRVNDIIMQLMSLVDKNCRYCYGKGSEGYNQTTKQPVICICVKKNVAKKGFRSLDHYMKSLNQPAVKEAREAINAAGEVGTVT